MTLDIAAIKARADKAKRYYALYSKTGMHVGLWPDRYTAESLLVQYPQGWIDDLVPVSALEASEAARVKAEQERDALKEAVADIEKYYPAQVERSIRRALEASK